MHPKFLVAGSSGLVGNAVVKKLQNLGHTVIGISSKDVDLRDLVKTRAVLSQIKPTIVIDAAAKVGGIKFNNDFPVDFLLDNLKIQNNLMQISHEIKVQKFVFLGSSCIYPRNSLQPIKEEFIMTGPLEQTNSAYALAKITGVELVKSYRKQYNHQWISLMPTNVYGPNDNFHLNTSHVIPALINKFVQAKRENSDKVEVWGSGKACREFIYSDDLADAILFCLENYNDNSHLNIGTGKDISIIDLAKLISKIVGFNGEIELNTKYPDGTPRKLLDINKLTQLGFTAKTSLEEGLRSTVNWYIGNPKE
jgi:GDP-L-fucose synthase